VFFKHKYLTMPTITPADALIRAADDLTDALTGVVPPPNMTRDAVDQLMRIFKQQAEKAKEDASTQRVLKKGARDERVHNEESTQRASPLPPLEVTYPAIDVGTLRGTPVISQDDDDSTYATPSANTRFQCQIRTLTQDYLYHMMDVPGITMPFTNQQAATRRYPVAFIRDFASAVLDEETGNLLEYHHLLKHPKYKVIWSKSFGTEIRRLATTTETIAFMSKEMIPQNRHKDITYGRIVCTHRSEKTDPYRTCITMGGNLINYPDDCGTPTADLLTVKLLFNSIISTPNCKFMTIGIKDFYLMTPMDRYKYFRMKLELFPPDIIEEYGLHDKVDGTAMCFVKSDVACMVSRKQVSSRKTSSPNYSIKPVTTKAKSHQGTGDTTGAPSVLHSLLMTSV